MPIVDQWDDDPDMPLEQDLDSDDDADDDILITCPSCGGDVYDDAPKCPHCGDWIVEPSASARLHWVWLLTAVVILAAFVAVYVF